MNIVVDFDKEDNIVGIEIFTKRKNKMEKPKCEICQKEMENAIDSRTGEISKYLWRTTCEHNKNLILACG